MKTCCSHKITLNAVFKVDPTRTVTQRNAFVREMRKRFKKLTKAVTEVIKGGILIKDNLKNPLLFNTDWESFYDPKKIPEFKRWLAEQADLFILSKGEAGLEIISRPGTQWTDSYIHTAYQKGRQRGRAELAKGGVPVVDEGQFLSPGFNAPIHTQRMESIFTQTYEGLVGVTERMQAPLARIMTQAMGEGKNPREVARLINKTINKEGKLNAERLARTEFIRAHHQANITEYELAGIEGVKVKAEWSTAGDPRVCQVCQANEGKVFTLKQIRWLIPIHPNCRCVAIPIVPSHKKFKRPRVRRVATGIGKKGKVAFEKV